MKMFLIFAVVIAAAMAAAIDQETTILSQTQDVGIDSYNFAFETSDGTKREESGQLKNLAPEVDALQVRGSIEWVAPNGEKLVLRYVADENGYQPEADFLPVAPQA